jgi:hypothetical protein
MLSVKRPQCGPKKYLCVSKILTKITIFKNKYLEYVFFAKSNLKRFGPSSSSHLIIELVLTMI